MLVFGVPPSRRALRSAVCITTAAPRASRSLGSPSLRDRDHLIALVIIAVLCTLLILLRISLIQPCILLAGRCKATGSALGDSKASEMRLFFEVFDRAASFSVVRRTCPSSSLFRHRAPRTLLLRLRAKGRDLEGSALSDRELPS
jgi:hypothetical protein